MPAGAGQRLLPAASAATPMLRTRRAKRAAVLVGAGAAVATLALVAAVWRTSRRADGAAVLAAGSSAASLDYRYLAAEAKGDVSMLQKLQRVWFVMSNKKGMQSVAAESGGVATQLMSAAFPTTVRTNLNQEVNPCDDFYEYACGGWDKANHNSIPKYQTSWALSWDHASNHIQDKMLGVLAEDEGAPGTYYRSCTDVDRIEKAGFKPILPWLQLVDKVQDHQSLVDTVVEFNKANMDMFFSWYIDTDAHDNTQNAFFLTQSDVSLPDQSYFTDVDDPEMVGHVRKFEERVGHFFKLIGRPDPEGEAKLVVKYERALAEIMVDRTTAYKEHAQRSSWEDVEKMAPAWPWKQWLHKLSTCTKPFNGVPQGCTKDHEDVQKVGSPGGKPLYIRNADFFPRFNKFLQTMPAEAIRAEMRWQVVNGAAPSLSTPFQDGMLDWMKDLYGVQERSARPRKCFYATTGTVAWASAKLYATKLFHQENRQAALDMLGNIREQFLKAIPHADWMTEKNREDAQHKLREMVFEVGVPTDKDGKIEWPERVFALDGKLGPDYFRNGEIATRLSMNRALSKLTRHPERRSWGGSTPLEVNAFYGPKSNGLWIPAGILQAPFFDYENSDAQNYGSVGTILGHEMSHGFDDDGRRYDAKGEMKDWWEPATVEGFKKRSSCISSLFSTYKVLDKPVNGKLTLGEDIADAGGIKFAYRAFLQSKPRSDHEKRLFFTSFAQTWCEVDRKKSALNSVMTDEHAPGKFRVIGGLTQFRPFSEAFHCPAGAPMAPKDESRCHLW